MAWVQILTTTQTNDGAEVRPKYPTTFRVEGTIPAGTVLQSRRTDGNVWNTEHNFAANAQSKSTTVVGFEGGSTAFRIVAGAAGIEGFYNTAAPNNDPG